MKNTYKIGQVLTNLNLYKVGNPTTNQLTIQAVETYKDNVGVLAKNERDQTYVILITDTGEEYHEIEDIGDYMPSTSYDNTTKELTFSVGKYGDKLMVNVEFGRLEDFLEEVNDSLTKYKDKFGALLQVYYAPKDLTNIFEGLVSMSLEAIREDFEQNKI